MALKDIFKKMFRQTDSSNTAESSVIPFSSDIFPVLKIESEELLKYKKIPLVELSLLGNAFSQIPESARTVVSTVTKTLSTNETLFVGINPNGISGFLRENEYGTVGNIMQVNSQGKQVIAGRMRFKAIDKLPVKETTTTTLPLDPTLIVVAAVLATIEKKLDSIQKSVEDVLQFLKQEKQSRQRGNLNMLSEILEDYKSNCNNDTFCISRTNEILSIKTAAYQDINFYQSQIDTDLQKKKTLHSSKDAQTTLDSIAYQFAEYQLACHLFAFSTFLDILLGKHFDIAIIENATNKMEEMIKRYEALYSECYSQISKYQHSAIEAKLLSGVGTAAKGLGKAVGSMPIIKNSSADEALINVSNSIGKYNEETVQKKLQKFKTLEDSHMNLFVENLNSVNLIYNTENAMITDGENLYFLQ